MSHVLIFTGQGSHRPGMGYNLYNEFPKVKSKFDDAESILGFDIKEIMFSDNEELLRKTKYAQIAIYLYSVCLFDILSPKIGEIKAVAGHSLGEFSALYSNKTYSFETGLRIVHARSKAMNICEEKYPGAMTAVIGIEKEKLDQICKLYSSQIANINSANQIVISGTTESVKKTSEYLTTLKIKSIPLKVSGAFHSNLMSEAKDSLKKIIDASEFSKPYIPIISNIDAQAKVEIDDIKYALIHQVDSPVLWYDSIFRLKSFSNSFVELGPKSVLSAMVKKIDNSLQTIHYNSYNDLI